MATVDTAGSDGISDGEAAPAPVPTDRTAPMQGAGHQTEPQGTSGTG
jgi:hypothetical protein